MLTWHNTVFGYLIYTIKNIASIVHQFVRSLWKSVQLIWFLYCEKFKEHITFHKRKLKKTIWDGFQEQKELSDESTTANFTVDNGK